MSDASSTLTVRVETEMTQKNGIISSVFVRSINQTIFEDREIEGIPCTLEEIDMEACRSIVWQEKLMEGLKGSVVSQIDGLYNTKDNTITLKIWIKIFMRFLIINDVYYYQNSIMIFDYDGHHKCSSSLFRYI